MPKTNICADSSLHGAFDGSHTVARSTCTPGNRNHRRHGHVFVASNILGNGLGVIFHDKNDGIFPCFGKGMQDLTSAVGIRCFMDGKADGHKSQHTVALANDTDLIHSFP